MSRRHPFLTWFGVYSALALVVTFPLVLRLSTSVAHDLGDPLMSVSLLWWNAHVVPLTERWWNGFAFFPTPGMVAFSDHRLGESLLATPLQWIGCSPVTAYNLTLLATFPLCAIGAHALAYVLTRRHDASALCGLAYGFNPYRMAHLPHLELLAAFGMPLALAALHMAVTTRRRRWMAALAAALVVQGLCTSYYIAFFAVLLALWLPWFIRRSDAWLLPFLAGAVACLAAALLPLAIGYARIHATYGMFRNFGEVVAFSADVTSVVTATSQSLLWGWTSGLNGGEGQIFVGFVIAALTAAGAIVAVRSRRVPRDAGDRLAAVLGLFALAAAGVAFFAKHLGPGRASLGPISVSVDAFFKPISVSMACAILAVAVSSRARDAWRRRSPLAFYTAATAIMFLCSFGPKPKFLGQQVLYEPPYAWLMRLPIFSTEIRVPARFAMLAALTLSAAAALAFNRLALRPSVRRIAAGALMMGILADGAITGLDVPRVPDPLPAERLAAIVGGFDALVEMPLGDTMQDASAMYRATVHGRTIVNGSSGYAPADYEAMAAAVRERDTNVLDAIAATGHVLFAVDTHSEPSRYWSQTLGLFPRATLVAEEGAWRFFTVVPAPLDAPCQAGELRVASASSAGSAVNIDALRDRNPATYWQRLSQREGDSLVLDMGQKVLPCGLEMSLGREAFGFPRVLNISTSADGNAWTTAFEGSTITRTVRGALDRPTDAWLAFSLSGVPTRFLRLELRSSPSTVPWQISDILVRGTTQ